MKPIQETNLHLYFGLLCEDVRETNKKWNTDLHTGEPIQRNKGELLALIHSEVSEALEGVRKNLMDDHLTSRKMEEVELADAVIRIIDYCNIYDLDLMGAILEKNAYNKSRQDHTREARLAEGGKKI